MTTHLIYRRVQHAVDRAIPDRVDEALRRIAPWMAALSALFLAGYVLYVLYGVFVMGVPVTLW